jgi:hypothetical protein
MKTKKIMIATGSIFTGLSLHPVPYLCFHCGTHLSVGGLDFLYLCPLYSFPAIAVGLPEAYGG